MILLLIFFL